MANPYDDRAPRFQVRAESAVPGGITATRVQLQRDVLARPSCVAARDLGSRTTAGRVGGFSESLM
jgi:hypothetical protein